MARLFSVNFCFQQKEHLALVSIREQGVDMYCQVRYADDYLNRLLGGKCFVFSLFEGLKNPSGVVDELMQSLLASTTEAIQHHLKDHPSTVY